MDEWINDAVAETMWRHGGGVSRADRKAEVPRHAGFHAKKKGLENIQALLFGGGGGNYSSCVLTPLFNKRRPPSLRSHVVSPLRGSAEPAARLHSKIERAIKKPQPCRVEVLLLVVGRDAGSVPKTGTELVH